MLVSLLDHVSGIFSRRWLMGRRIVVDLGQAEERRVAVVALPKGSFSFGLRERGDMSELILAEEGQPERVLGTFADPLAGEHVLKKIKFGMVRPLRKIVWAAVGLFIVIAVSDVATTSKEMRLGRAGQADAGAQGSSRTGPLGLTPEQMSSLNRQGGPRPVQGPAQSSLPPRGSTPETDAAIKLLKGE